MVELNEHTIVDHLADIIERRGGESYLGEAVTMREHMLQAAQLASASGASDEVVAAALLHDIGHFSGEFPVEALDSGIDNRHQRSGADILSPYFPPLVVECVRQHVDAKRYLCATDDGYHDQLSQASKHSLELQGGAMDAAEAERFAKRDALDAITAVRRFDDEAKVPGRITPGFDAYRPLLMTLVARHLGRPD